jgi:hypothetical protein
MRQAARSAWPVYKRHYGLFMAFLLALFGAWVVLEIVVVVGQDFGIWLWAAAHVAFFILFAGLEVGFLQICLALSHDREQSFLDLFGYMTLGPKFLVAQLLYLVIVLVGLALLVLPGIYLGVRYALFGLCLVTGEANVTRSFQKSTALSSGIMINLLLALMALLLLNILGASLLGLGLFVTVPLSVLILVGLYQQLTE